MENVSGAIGLYQFAIDTLGRIQLAQSFRDDFEMYQLKLDILQLRLSRWGEIVDIVTVDDKNKAQGTGKEDQRNVVALLEEIHDRLHKARRESERESRKWQKDPSGRSTGAQALDPEACLPTDLKKIRTRFTEFLRKRKARASSVVQGIKWVFYQKQQFDTFVANITELIDGLENIIREEERERFRQLSDAECKGISRSNLEELKLIVEGCDPWLETAVDTELESTRGGTIINQSRNMGSTVGIHNGDNKGITYGPNSTQTNTFQ
ncbi:prion-inhibition and propagation-domain-containing protein [Aspergillus aurantiobrunneus]